MYSKKISCPSELKNLISPLIFGGQYPGEKNFEGTIDDIGIWNRALTQQEITDLYNGNICYQHITVTDTLIINTNLVGFNPVTYQNSIKIFPNPTNDFFSVRFNLDDDGKIEASLYDIGGRKVASLLQTQGKKGLNELNFSLAPLAQGIYLVKIIANDKELLKEKVVKR